MSIFVQISGRKLFSGMSVAELQPLTTAQITAMTVSELQAFENTHVLADPVPTIDHRIEERSTATFDILDMEEHHSFEYGQEVLIRDEQGRLFGGQIGKLRTDRRKFILYLFDRNGSFRWYMDQIPLGSRCTIVRRHNADTSRHDSAI